MKTYTIGEELSAFMVVIASSFAGGLATGLIFGIKIPKWGIFPGLRLQPVVSSVAIPPLILMIIMGCISRNLFGEKMDAFPREWSIWIRSISLCLILIRGGMNVSFSGKGFLFGFMATIPSWLEAITITFIVQRFFDMPLTLCFAIGFLIAAVSPSITVPGLLTLID